VRIKAMRADIETSKIDFSLIEWVDMAPAEPERPKSAGKAKSGKAKPAETQPAATKAAKAKTGGRKK